MNLKMESVMLELVMKSVMMELVMESVNSLIAERRESI